MKSILKQLRNNHFLSFAGNMIMAVIGMLTILLLAHNFSTKEDVGNWVFFILNMVTLADVFRTGFLQNSLIKFYSGTAKERSDSISGAAWYIGFVITLAGCAINLLWYLWYVIFHPAVTPATLIMMHWFGVVFLAMLPYSVATWILQAEERFGMLLIVRGINQCLQLLFMVVLILTDRLTFLNAVYANFLTCVLTSAVTMIAGWDRLRTVGHRTKESIRELFHYGKFSVGTSIAAQFLKASDTYIINFMLPGAAAAAAVGMYGMAQQLMQVIEIFIRSFTATAMPMISAASNQGDNNKVVYLMKKFAGMITLALIPVCLVCFVGADVFMHILGGKKFIGSESVGVFRIFMFFAIMLPLDRFMGITLDMINKPRANMIKVYIMLAVNVIGDIAGLLIFKSIYGVAGASIITFIVGTLYGYWTLKKYLNFKIGDIFTLGYAELKMMISNIFKRFSKAPSGE